jgi:hypothetical protein
LLVSVIFGATFLAILRQLRFGYKVLESDRVGADHVAHDLKRALLIEAVLVIIDDRFSVFPIAAIGHKPPLRRLGEHAVRKSRFYMNERQGGEGISGIFLSSKHR